MENLVRAPVLPGVLGYGDCGEGGWGGVIDSCGRGKEEGGRGGVVKGGGLD